MYTISLVSAMGIEIEPVEWREEWIVFVCLSVCAWVWQLWPTIGFSLFLSSSIFLFGLFVFFHRFYSFICCFGACQCFYHENIFFSDILRVHKYGNSLFISSKFPTTQTFYIKFEKWWQQIFPQKHIELDYILVIKRKFTVRYEHSALIDRKEKQT